MLTIPGPGPADGLEYLREERERPQNEAEMQDAITNHLHAAASAPASMALEIPDYDVLETLGSGGYGTVYRGRHQRTGASVAIKVVRLQAGSRHVERFHRETLLCAALHHPHIVQLLDKGQQGDIVYGVFEYVPGETLKSLIRRQGALSALETGRLMAEVLDALDCAHAAGIVHRDLKPDNVMVTFTGAMPHVMVLDFGIGTVIPQIPGPQLSQLTMGDEALGTPAYSAPEQLRGEPPSARTDLYAWGLMFLECLTGTPAVQGASAAEIMHQQLSHQEVPLPPGIASHPIAALLRRALRKKVSERSESAAVLLKDLMRTRLDDLVGVLQASAHAQSEDMTRTMATTRAFSEMRQLTVLCCSVSVWPGEASATPVARPLNIEDIELLQREELALFAEAATRRGGVLGGTLGDRMIVLFGYPRASDTDARQAGITAQELLALSVERSAILAQEHGVHLGLRMGMHTGMAVVAGGEAPLGHAVNVAMRLEAVADSGSLLASESSHRLLARHARFEKAGLVSLPGQPAGIATYRLDGQPHSQPAPALADDGTTALCIGREPELQQLRQAWAQACAGTGTVAWIRGEPGIGKSCLADMLRMHADQQGARTIVIQCQPEHRNTALMPFLGLIRQRLEAGAPQDPLELLRQGLSAAGCDTDAVLPIFCTWLDLPLGDCEPSRFSPVMQKALLLQSAAQWLLHMAASLPLLLVIEDMHWADPTSIELMEQFAALLPRQRVLLVLTARPEWQPSPQLQADCVDVWRLADGQAAELARQALAPHQVSPAVVRHIVDRTDGVPLFIQEMARMLLDAYLVDRDGVWDFRDTEQPAAIPLTLRDSLVSRFDRIGPLKQLLLLAASIGRQFELGLLCACADRPREAVAQDLAELGHAGLVIPDERSGAGAFMFRHALIRDTAYECMLVSQRRQLHRDVAQAMVQHYPQRVATEPAGVAQHWADAGDYAQAVFHAVQQLRITQLRSLNDETLAYAHHINDWLQSLPAHAQSEARLDVNGYVTQAMMNKHGWAHAQVVEHIGVSQDLLTDSVANDKQVQHLWMLITYHHVASNREEVRRLSRRLLGHASRLQDTGVLVAAQTYMGLAHYSDGRFDLAERMLSSAIDQYDSVAHAHHAAEFGFDTRVWAMTGRALVRWFAGHDQDARTDAEQAVRLAHEVSHIPSLSMALLYQSLGHQARGDRQAALASTGELLDISARYGLPAFTGYAQIIRCWADGSLEQIASADATAQLLWDMGCRYCQSYYRSFAAETLAAHERWDEAVQRIDECLSLVDVLDERMHSAELYLKKARYLLAMDAERAIVQSVFAQAACTARAAGKYRIETEALAMSEALAPARPDVARRLRELAAMRPDLAVLIPPHLLIS
jgi:TOMM system kinase/cyclase fusion protein